MWLLMALTLVGFSGDLLRYTITWAGYGLVTLALIVTAGVMLYRNRSWLQPLVTPTTLLLFTTWCGLSIIWSEYRLETSIAWLIQLTIIGLGFTTAALLTREEFLQAFASALRVIVAGSLIFELGVALFTGDGLIPPAYFYGNDLEFFFGSEAPQKSTADFPSTMYWSYGHLIEGGAIQGLPGNRNLLAMVTLFAIATTVTQLLDARLRKSYGLAFLAVAFYTLLRTRSATSLVTFGFMLLGAALVFAGRRIQRRWRWALYAGVGTVLVSGAVLVVRDYEEVFALMNRSSDMSGRGDIWRAVLQFGAERPITGHGWISYWAPWLPQFDDLGVVGPTAHQQAHNAFLDVWMQTGHIGVALFALLVLATLVRAWWQAIDRPTAGTLTATHALGFILAIGLVVQSTTESRLLVEGYWFLLCFIAFAARQHQHELPSTQPIRQAIQASVTSPVRRRTGDR